MTTDLDNDSNLVLGGATWGITYRKKYTRTFVSQTMWRLGWTGLQKWLPQTEREIAIFIEGTKLPCGT